VNRTTPLRRADKELMSPLSKEELLADARSPEEVALWSGAGGPYVTTQRTLRGNQIRLLDGRSGRYG
jgi:hypothetical protein